MTSPTAESAAGSGATLAGGAARTSVTAEAQPAEPQPAAPQPASSRRPSSSIRTSLTRTSLTRARIQVSRTAVHQPYAGVDKPVRRMRLRDQLELPREITDVTVLYLSPHYRLLPASSTNGRGNMYTELSAQLGVLGIKVVSAADATSVAEQQAFFLLLLCPGFFSCPELVEETAQALKGLSRRPRAAGSGGAEAGDGADTSLSDIENPWQEEGSLRLEGLQRQDSLGGQLGSQLDSAFSGRSRRKPSRENWFPNWLPNWLHRASLMPLMSTAMPYGEYARTCPPDLKDLGLFEVSKLGSE